MAEYYSGRVQAVVFANDAQSFYIMKMKLDLEEDDNPLTANVTVRGNIPGLEIAPGVWFGFEGKWEENEKYGRQIAIQKAPVLKGEWDTETAIKMLEGHGVGRRVCELLYEHFGEELITVLGDSDELQKAGLTKFSALHVKSRWQAVRAMFQSLEFLGDMRLPKNKVEQIYSHFGDDTERALSEDPWSLVQIDGISFDQADEVARRLGLDLSSETRLRGAALYTCKSKRGMGHLYLSSGELVQGISSVAPGVKKSQIAHILKQLHDENLMVLDNKTRPGTVAIYEPWFHSLEKETAILLAERKKLAQFDDEGRAEFLGLLGTVGPKSETAAKRKGARLKTVAKVAILEWSEHGALKLAKSQLEGAVNALVEPVSVLTGLPGTGKTSTLKVVVKVLQDANVPFLLVAPTGIAAKRLTAVTGADASTIHRAFGAKGMDTDNDRESTYAGIVGVGGSAMTEDGSKEFWGYSSAEPHPAKVVIVDESSMVDQHLLFRLLTCTARNCRLVFVGDAAQLPSVGPGNVLRDMITSGHFPVVNLQEIFRQDEASDIILAAHAINRGEVPEFKKRSKDFTFVEIQNDANTLETLIATAQKLYDRRANFQVLSPRHSGTLGVTNLNLRIRELLNPKVPGLKEMRLGAETIREGDRVMVSKNNYRYEIFNGDVGKVVRLDQKEKIVEIKIHGPPVMIVQLTFKDAPQYLRMAYCVTVHKCIHPDTLIETDEGIIRAGDARSSGVVGTAMGPKEYANKVENPVLPMLRITTDDGYEIAVTPDHGLDVWDADERKYVRREARDIHQRDFLRLRMGPGIEPVKVPRLPEDPQVDVRGVRFSFPKTLTKDIAEFFGLMVADGTIYDKGFRLAKRHLEVVDRFSVLVGQIFGAVPRRYTTNGAFHAEVNSVQIVRWLREVGGMDPHVKDVPSCILRASIELQRFFMRGLIEDGSVHLRSDDPGTLDHVEWSSVSPVLRRKVQILLLRMGIICGTLKGSNRTPSLQIYGQNARRFGEQVGFITPMKQKRCQLPVGAETHYVFPVDREVVKKLRRSFGKKVADSTYKNGVNRQRMSRHAAEQIIAATETPTQERDLLKEMLRDHHSPVASIEEIVAPSVCLEVPDGHQFLQNGFRGWNSQGQEYDVILMPWSSSFRNQLQRNLLYTAITRARKKVILIGHREAMEKAVRNNKVDGRNTLFPERLGEILD